MIKSWLQRTSELKFTLFALTAAFGVYFCMYAFRKPFTAASFYNKEILVIAQVIGYMVSKFYGIKFIAELKGEKRAYFIIFLIAFSHLSLLVFAYLPNGWRAYDFIWLFLNGLPLGVVWGIVFSYLEGRKLTEVLAAGLTVSFIIASGFVKSVGKYLTIEVGVSPYEMPFYSGLLFVPLLILFVWMLAQIPAPDEEDKVLRAERLPMNREDRRAFVRHFAPGIIILVVSYMMFTAFRDIRETFANEIWLQLGINDPKIFTQTELPIGIFIGFVMALCFRIRDNLVAFRFYHYLILCGLIFILFGSAAFVWQWIGPVTWMVLTGIGSYMAYVTFASVLFDRLMGAYRMRGNAGFMIYVVDATGYMGSVVILLYKYYFEVQLNWYQFFLSGSFLVSLIGILLTVGSLVYFSYRLSPTEAKVAA